MTTLSREHERPPWGKSQEPIGTPSDNDPDEIELDPTPAEDADADEQDGEAVVVPPKD